MRIMLNIILQIYNTTKTWLKMFENNWEYQNFSQKKKQKKKKKKHKIK